uniref:Uncharacterized protein n=1 Tax=Bionectria ochroleuca TaxID=29856 RepID=A0A0B7K1G5_BIOOC
MSCLNLIDKNLMFFGAVTPRQDKDHDEGLKVKDRGDNSSGILKCGAMTEALSLHDQNIN